jgi:rubrerythrin
MPKMLWNDVDLEEDLDGDDFVRPNRQHKPKPQSKAVHLCSNCDAVLEGEGRCPNCGTDNRKLKRRAN